MEWGRHGGYILVDFYNEGNRIAVADVVNDPQNRVNAPSSYKDASKEVWQPTKSAGEMSLLFDKGAGAIHEIVTPVKEIVNDVKGDVKDKDKVKEVMSPIEGAKDKWSLSAYRKLLTLSDILIAEPWGWWIHDRSA